MKSKTFITVLITIAIRCQLNSSLAQTTLETNGPDFWGSLDFTNQTTQALGVGDFRFGVQQPSAALHINTNNYTPSFFAAGDVFMTDAPTNGNATTWQMLHGGILRGTIFRPCWYVCSYCVLALPTS